jgi:hypothetical protein
MLWWMRQDCFVGDKYRTAILELARGLLLTFSPKYIHAAAPAQHEKAATMPPL